MFTQYILFLFLIILPSLYHMKFTPLNPIIDVGKDIYCQHNANNETIFPIKKSGEKYTKVYKIIIPTLTSSKMWLKNATLVDCTTTSSGIGATNKDNYIPVKEGEQYFFRIYGINKNSSVPVLLLDEKDNYIQDFFTGMYTSSQLGVELTVPAGATKMHITNYGGQSLSIQKIINMTDKEIDSLCINEETIMEKINNSYNEYVKNPIVYKKINKAYLTFVLDDTMNQDEDYINLFIDKGIPLSLGTIPEKLIENSLSGKKTKLDMAKKLISSGKGEILCQAGLLTEEKIGNFSEMYNSFIIKKQIFNSYGIEVNGILKPEKARQMKANEIEEKWAIAFYSYSDLYGLPVKYSGIYIDPVYNHPRGNLFNYNFTIENMKAEIDKIIDQLEYRIIRFHAGDNSAFANLSQLLDYVKLKEKSGEIDVGNYRDFYEKNAIRINDVIKDKHTYYVAMDGKSRVGLSENDPMNFERMKSKKFMTGDTILFKRGDIFYRQLEPNPIIVDNNVLTLSSYGDTKKGKPIFSCYKIINKKENWEKESDTIYRIDLTNPTKFQGINDITPESTKIGFVETKNKTKFYNVKKNLSELTELYDFYSNKTYFFMKTNGRTPYEELGELKLAPCLSVFIMCSNIKVENLHIQGTGEHGMRGNRKAIENIEIVDNIIEDIGGSLLERGERYGNGIDFYQIDVKNVKIHKNILRNTYDTAFTIQGNVGSGTNVSLTKNIFCLNSQDSEIWENDKATGIFNLIFEDNISFLAGRGWGYFARPDKYCACHILFWGLGFDNVEEKTKIYFNHNYVYNPKRIYFIAEYYQTHILFQNDKSIRSDFNHYY